MTADAPRSLLAMPARLAARGFVLRAESEADVPFLRRLYVSTRWEELAPLIDWSEAQKVAFLESQFAAQRHHYLTYYEGSAFEVLEAGGVPAGRLYLDRQSDKLLIVDISLLPEWRRQGIGTALIEAVFAEARTAGKAVDIAVEKFNPAQRLYRRLGFREHAEEGPYWFMRWRPDPDKPADVN